MRLVVVAVVLLVALGAVAAEEAADTQCGGGPCPNHNLTAATVLPCDYPGTGNCTNFVEPELVERPKPVSCACAPPPAPCGCGDVVRSDLISKLPAANATTSVLAPAPPPPPPAGAVVSFAPPAAAPPAPVPVPANVSKEVAASAVAAAQEVKASGGSPAAQQKAASMVAAAVTAAQKSGSRVDPKQLVSKIVHDASQDALNLDKEGMLTEADAAMASPDSGARMMKAAQKQIAEQAKAASKLNRETMKKIQRQLSQSKEETDKALKEIEAQKQAVLEQAQAKAEKLREETEAHVTKVKETAEEQARVAKETAEDKLTNKLQSLQDTSAARIAKRRAKAEKEVAEQRAIVQRNRAKMRAERRALREKARAAGREAAKLVSGVAAKRRAYAEAYTRTLRLERKEEIRSKTNLKKHHEFQQKKLRKAEHRAKVRQRKAHQRAVNKKRRLRKREKAKKLKARRRARRAARRRAALRRKALKRKHEKKHKAVVRKRGKEKGHKRSIAKKKAHHRQVLMLRKAKVAAKKQKARQRRLQRIARRKEKAGKRKSYFAVLHQKELRAKAAIQRKRELEVRRAKRVDWANNYIKWIRRIVKVQAWKRRRFVREYHEHRYSWEFERTKWWQPGYCRLQTRKRSLRLHMSYLAARRTMVADRLKHLQGFLRDLQKVSSTVGLTNLDNLERAADKRFRDGTAKLRSKTLAERRRFWQACRKSVTLRRLNWRRQRLHRLNKSKWAQKKKWWDKQIRQNRRVFKAVKREVVAEKRVENKEHAARDRRRVQEQKSKGWKEDRIKAHERSSKARRARRAKKESNRKARKARKARRRADKRRKRAEKRKRRAESRGKARKARKARKASRRGAKLRARQEKRKKVVDKRKARSEAAGKKRKEKTQKTASRANEIAAKRKLKSAAKKSKSKSRARSPAARRAPASRGGKTKRGRSRRPRRGGSSAARKARESSRKAKRKLRQQKRKLKRDARKAKRKEKASKKALKKKAKKEKKQKEAAKKKAKKAAAEKKSKAKVAEISKKKTQKAELKAKEKQRKAAERARERSKKERAAKKREREGYPIQLENKWEWIGYTYEKPVYRREGALCIVSGTIRVGTFAPRVATLPPNCRPFDGTHIFSLLLNGDVARVDVGKGGEVTIITGRKVTAGWLSLNGITFVVNDADQSPMNLESGWVPYGGGYAPPSIFQPEGICMMSGLAKNGAWGYMQTVPDECKPFDGRALFNTNNHDANTRWDILRNGQMHFTGGRRNYGWTSLDGMIWPGKVENERIDLLSGFINYDHDYRPAKWSRAGRVCMLSGLISRNNMKQTVMARLPKACRPAKRIIMGGPHLNELRVRLDILPDGQVILAGAWFGWDWFSLEGVAFVADIDEEKDEIMKAQKHAKKLEKQMAERRARYMKEHPDYAKAYHLAQGKKIRLTSGFSVYSKSYMAPSWRVFDGICFLSGVMKFPASYVQGAIKVGDLPADCRPRNGQLIFQTLKGTGVVRLDINSAGSMVVQFAHPGATARWMSLSGIFFNIQTHALPGFDMYHNWVNYGHGYRATQANLHKVDKKEFCMISGLVRNGRNDNPTARIPIQCRVRDGRLIWATSNHNAVSRLDLDTSGNLHFPGGQRAHGWRNFDGAIWAIDGGNEMRLANGWRQYNSGYRRAKWQKIGSLCLLSGLIANGDFTAGFITRLPETCRPPNRQIFSVSGGTGNSFRVDVLPDGHVIWVHGKAYGWVSLSNIAFIATPHSADVGTSIWDSSISCRNFWKDKQGGCLDTHTRKSGADNQGCNPFLGTCNSKCCTPKHLTCDQYFRIANGGKCPAGWRQKDNVGGRRCYVKPDGGDSCHQVCCTYIKPGGGGKCTNWGDPHVISFDGVGYDCRNNGEFVMVSLPNQNEEIHNLQRKNPRRDIAAVPPFNIGLAWRSGGNLFSLELLPPMWEIFRLQLRFNGKLVQWPEKLTHYGDFAVSAIGELPGPYAHFSDIGFHTTMLNIVNKRTGVSVTINPRQIGYYQRYIDLHITIPKPHQKSWGLCGTWDGNRNNDLMVKGGGRTCNGHTSDVCCNTYQVDAKQSYFKKPPKNSKTASAPNKEELCQTADKLAQANRACAGKGAMKDNCFTEICAGGSASEIGKTINRVTKGSETPGK